MHFDASTEPQVFCPNPTVVPQQDGAINSEDGVFHISLATCLSCSGCSVTEDEVRLVAQQNPAQVLEELKSHSGFSVIISDVALANFAAFHYISLNDAFLSLQLFFVSLGSSSVTLDTVWQEMWRELLLYSYNASMCPSPFLISRCPATCKYIEQKTGLSSHLAPVRPPAQLYAHYIKSFGPTYVVSVVTCTDRKFETARFPGDVDAALTIAEIAPMIPVIDNEGCTSANLSRFSTDAEFLVARLGAADEVASEAIGRSSTRLSGNGCAALVVNGEANIRRVVNDIKNGACPYQIVELNICPESCPSGGGLIRLESPAQRRALVAATKEVLRINRGGMAFRTHAGAETLLKMFTFDGISAVYKDAPHVDDFDF